MSNNFDEDWAIFPFDQTTDGRRWVKLIEEINDLVNNSEISRVRLVENSVTARSAQPRLTQNSFNPDDDGLSEQSLF
jgi:hypothetical protein